MTPEQSARFRREMTRLVDAQVAATTPDERDLADHDLALFLRLHLTERLDEWFAVPRGTSVTPTMTVESELNPDEVPEPEPDPEPPPELDDLSPPTTEAA